MKKTILLIGLCFRFFCAYAYQIVYGENVTITKPVFDDVYISGGTITINAPIHGDLTIAGGTIIINDSVANDILLAGGNVTFNGFVGDDIRCAGGNIRISKDVSGDVVIAAGTVVIDKGVTIGNLLAGSGNVTVDGNVNGEVRGGVGEFILNGMVNKNFDCRGGKITMNGTVNGNSIISAAEIFIGNNAIFVNDVRYWNKKGSLDFKQALKNSKATYDTSLQVQTGEWYYLGAATIIGLIWYLGMALLMIMIIEYLFEHVMKNAADTVFNNALKSFGIGFLYFIVVPIIAIIAFVTIIGVPIGVLLLLSYIFLIVLAAVITSLVIAHWFNNRNSYAWKYWRIVFVAFFIFVLVKFIAATPFVGWVFIMLLTCMAFGGILLNINWKRKGPRYKQVKINNPL
jgi:hypothetical protein